MYIYYDNQGKIKMITETPIFEKGNLKQKKIVPTQEFLNKSQQNYLLLYKDGKITYEQNPFDVNKELRTKREMAKEMLSTLQNNPEKTTDELVKDLITLISNII